MVEDHSDSERGKPLPPHGLLFPISSKGYLLEPRERITDKTACVTGWNEKQLNGYTMKDRPDNPSHHKRTLSPRSYMSLLSRKNPYCRKQLQFNYWTYTFNADMFVHHDSIIIITPILLFSPHRSHCLVTMRSRSLFLLYRGR